MTGPCVEQRNAGGCCALRGLRERGLSFVWPLTARQSVVWDGDSGPDLPCPGRALQHQLAGHHCVLGRHRLPGSLCLPPRPPHTHRYPTASIRKTIFLLFLLNCAIILSSWMNETLLHYIKYNENHCRVSRFLPINIYWAPLRVEVNRRQLQHVLANMIYLQLATSFS